MHGSQVKLIEQMAGDSGLIGCNGDCVTRLAERCNGLYAAGDGHPLLSRLDVIVGVFVDDTIPVENDQLHVTLNWFADKIYQRPLGTGFEARRGC